MLKKTAPLFLMSLMFLVACFDQSVENSCPDKLIHNEPSYVSKEPGVFSRVDEWVPPVHMKHDGTIDEVAQAQCKNNIDSSKSIEKPYWCLSTVQVYTKSPYIATVEIFNQGGRKIQSSTQRFGYCGELYNDEQLNFEGSEGSLIWNLRDSQGTYAGPGNYTWKVKFQFEDTVIHKTYENKLICDSGQPGTDCISNYMNYHGL